MSGVSVRAAIDGNATIEAMGRLSKTHSVAVTDEQGRASFLLTSPSMEVTNASNVTYTIVEQPAPGATTPPGTTPTPSTSSTSTPSATPNPGTTPTPTETPTPSPSPTPTPIPEPASIEEVDVSSSGFFSQTYTVTVDLADGTGEYDIEYVLRDDNGEELDSTTDSGVTSGTSQGSLYDYFWDFRAADTITITLYAADGTELDTTQVSV